MRIAFVAQPRNNLSPPVRQGSLALWNAQVAEALVAQGHAATIFAERRYEGCVDQVFEGVSYRFLEPSEPPPGPPGVTAPHWQPDFRRDYAEAAASAKARGAELQLRAHGPGPGALVEP